jgi:hypothetical protein
MITENLEKLREAMQGKTVQRVEPDDFGGATIWMEDGTEINLNGYDFTIQISPDSASPASDSSASGSPW